jgi:hypothetical protein
VYPYIFVPRYFFALQIILKERQKHGAIREFVLAILQLKNSRP